MKALIISLITLFFHAQSVAQTIVKPVVGAKSHSSLSIQRVERSALSTIIYLSVKNQTTGGWFCADRNIYIENAENEADRYDILQSEGIPTCPERHQFSKQGEVLNFKLFFPVLPKGIIKINLVEDCADACFFFNEVIVDAELNSEIKLFEEAFVHYSKRNMGEALRIFKKMVREKIGYKNFRYGYAFYSIPIIYERQKNVIEAEKWYLKLLLSDVRDDMSSESLKDKYTNYKHRACIRLANLYRKNLQYPKALQFLIKAESEFPYQPDIVGDYKSIKTEIDILLQTVGVYKEMKAYRTAINTLIYRILTSNHSSFYDKPEAELSELIEQHYGSKKFHTQFNLALRKMKLQQKNGQTHAAFNFNSQVFKIKYFGKKTKADIIGDIRGHAFYKKLY